MPTDTEMRLPIPKSAAEFESICKDVLALDNNNKNVQKYGGPGQKQHGIDILFKNDKCKKSDVYAVVQCKNYYKTSRNQLITKIKKDIEAAKALPFVVVEFIVMTTFSRDAEVQNEIIKLNNDEDYTFDISIKFWDEIEEDLLIDKKICKKYYPSLHTIGIEELKEINFKKSLFLASKKQLDKIVSKSNIASPLDIVERILPSYDEYNRADFKLVSDEKGSLKSINDALEDKDDSCYIVGEGGVGKTTSLVRYADYLLQKGYSEDCVVPIFIELNKSRYVLEEWCRSGGKNSVFKTSVFLLNEIRRYLGVIDVDVEIEYIEKELLSSTNKGEYVLLLDGLNEVSSDRLFDDARDTTIRQAIITELQNTIREFNNVRIILTSRPGQQISFNQDITTINLYGLTDETIVQHLEESNCKEIISQVKNNSELMKILRVPLFLTMFVKVANQSDLTQLTTRGELLYAFFNAKQADFYNQDSKLAESNFGRVISPKRASFILNIIVPAVFYKMENEQAFSINIDDVDVVTEKVLCEYSNNKRLVNKVFRKILDSGNRSVSRIANELQKIECVEDTIREFITDNISVLSLDGDNLSATHQYFRDYFAAIHYINTMRFSLSLFSKGEADQAIDLLDTTFDSLLSDNIQTLITEILAEYKNKPRFDKGRNKVVYNVPPQVDNSDIKTDYRRLLTDTLDIFRGRFSEEKSYAFINIFELLKKGRRDLSGEDFTSLDFKGCNFYDSFYGMGFLGGANFKDSKIYNSNFYIGHASMVNTAVYSPDGAKVLSASGDRTIKEWDVKSGALLKTYRDHIWVVNTAVYSPDGTKVLSASADKVIKEWNVRNGALIEVYHGHMYSVTTAVYSPDGDKVLSASDDRTVKEWDVTSGTCIKTYHGHTDSVTSAMYSPDGNKVLSASRDKTIKEWDVESGAQIKTYRGHAGGVNTAVYSPDGDKVLSASDDRTIKEWAVKSGAQIKTYLGHTDCVITAMYNPDGTKVLSASDDKTIKEWDVKSGVLIKTYRGHAKYVNTAVYSADGKKVISASDDKTIKEWDVKSGALIKMYHGHTYWVNTAVYSPDGTKALSAATDKTIKEWDVKSSALIKTYHGHTSGVTSAVYSADGTKVLSASLDKTIKEWDVKSGALIKTYHGHTSSVTTAVYSADGSKVLSASSDKTIKEWDVKSGTCIKTYHGHTSSVTTAMYSADGTKILSVSDDKMIKEWDVKSGALIKTYRGHTGPVNTAVYSSDGTKILSASNDNTIKEWDVKSGVLLKIYKGYIGSFNTAMYSRDGKKVLSTSRYGLIKEWDVKSGTLIKEYKADTRSVNTMVYSLDGMKVLSASSGGTIIEWDVTTGKTIQKIINTPFSFVGCNFNNLHPDTDLDDYSKAIIKKSGGICDF